MKEKLADTIRRISIEHLEKNNGLLFGQCLTAVGWVGGTVPEMTEAEGLVELSMADVMGGGIVVGAALAGRRPIYVVRYQGFQWYNAPMLVNYAAKSKEMWGVACPGFIRSIAMDGGIGPVASGSHHSIFTRMPGIPVVAPVTPKEYELVYKHFMEHDDPIYVSEHRRTFPVDYEMPNRVSEKADITLLPISSTRLNTLEAITSLEKQGINCNNINLLWLKPLDITPELIESINNSKYGALVIDGDYEDGVAKTIAYDLMHLTNKKVYTLGLDNRVTGFAPHLDNLPPDSKKIESKVKKIIRGVING